jgi:phage-related protein
MPVFDWAEGDASRVSHQPRVRRTVFGDGYEQRSPDGLNAIAQTWSLTFNNVDNAIADDIEAFLTAQKGCLAFDWTPKWKATPIKVVCEGFERAIDGEFASNLSCTFRQVFEP